MAGTMIGAYGNRSRSGGGGGGVFVKKVNATDTAFPTKRADGTALKAGDYVEPEGTLPFTLEGITFKSLQDKAEWNGASWIYREYIPQDTLATVTNDAASESISGEAANQKAVNVENKAAIEQHTTAIEQNTADIETNRQEILKRIETAILDNRTLIIDTDGKLKASCQAAYKNANTVILDGNGYVSGGHFGDTWTLPNGRQFIPGETVTIQYNCAYWSTYMSGTVTRTVKADGTIDPIQASAYGPYIRFTFSKNKVSYYFYGDLYSAYSTTCKITAKFDFSAIKPVCIPVDLATLGVNTANGYIYVLDKGLTFAKLADAMVAQSISKTSPSTAKVATEKAVADAVASISMGRIVSLWDCTTGKADPSPATMPYTYQNGDYYIVKKVAGEGGVNYMPDGTVYDGTPSTKTETGEVQVGDFYHYNGSEWAALINGSTLKPDNTTIKKDSSNVLSTTIGGSVVENPDTTVILEDKTLSEAIISPVILGDMQNNVAINDSLNVNIQTPSGNISETVSVKEDSNGLFILLDEGKYKGYFASGDLSLYRQFPSGNYEITLSTVDSAGAEMMILQYIQTVGNTIDPINLGTYLGTVKDGDTIKVSMNYPSYVVSSHIVTTKDGVLQIEFEDFVIKFASGNATFYRSFAAGTYSSNIIRPGGTTITPIDMRVVKVDDTTIGLDDNNRLKSLVPQAKADNKTIVYDEDGNMETAIGGWEQEETEVEVVNGAFEVLGEDTFLTRELITDEPFKGKTESINATVTGTVNAGWEGNEVVLDNQEVEFIYKEGNKSFSCVLDKVILILYSSESSGYQNICTVSPNPFDKTKSNANVQIKMIAQGGIHPIDGKFIPISSEEDNALELLPDGLYVPDSGESVAIDEKTIIENELGEIGTAVGGYIEYRDPDRLDAIGATLVIPTPSPISLGSGVNPLQKGETVNVLCQTPRSGRQSFKCVVDAYGETKLKIDLSSAVENIIITYDADNGYQAVDTHGGDFEAGEWAVAISSQVIEVIHKIDPRFYDAGSVSPDGKSIVTDPEGKLAVNAEDISEAEYQARKTAGTLDENKVYRTPDNTPASVGINELFDIIYPVGSVYVSVGATLPAGFRGTWERLDDDYYLVSASSGQGDLLNAELPNIKGSTDNYGDFTIAAPATKGTGAFVLGNDVTPFRLPSAGDGATTKYLTFDANKSNSIYKDGGKVQPKSVKCSMWKRTI